MKSNPKRRFQPLAGRALALFCAALLMLAAAGCQRMPTERIPKMKWLVMPFEQPTAMSDTPRAIRGWWFGARTIRQNPRAGILMAETLMRTMGDLDYVALYSPIELKYYFADKRQLLSKEFGYLSKDELDKLMAEVPATEFARELGADKILSGRIITHYMGDNRTIHWWWSTVELEAWVMDAHTGQVEWSRRYKERDQFASQNGLQEKIGRRILKDLNKEYFLPLSR